MAYRVPQPPSDTRRTHDLGGLGLLAVLGLSGLLPFLPALLSGARIEGQSAVGFGIALGALILAVQERRRSASLPVRPPGPVPSRPHVRPLPDPPRHR